MLYRVERLDNVLRAWEDYWQLMGLINRILILSRAKPLCSRERAILYYDQLRSFLLRKHSPNEVIDITPWASPLDDKMKGNFLSSVVAPITAWCVHGRRVFEVNRELQAILSATSLAKIKWSDIVLPFPAFAISLNNPLIDSKDRYDFLLFGVFELETGETAIDVRCFAADCDSYRPLASHDLQNVQRYLRNKNLEGARKAALRLFRRLEVIRGTSFSLHGEIDDLTVSDVAELAYEACQEQGIEIAIDPRPIWQAMINIVASISLYLCTLPAHSPHCSSWTKKERDGLVRNNIITDEAEICTLTNSFILSVREKQLLERIGEESNGSTKREVGWHFRSAHKRRRPGQGHNPLAPKEVRVSWAIVRPDLQPDKGLFGGTREVL